MKTNLITLGGYEKLQQELEHLWRVERRETVEKVSWAASLGDRSENADYKYNKQKLRKIDGRIRYLTKRLEQVKVVYYSPQQDGKVFLVPGWKLRTRTKTCAPFKLSVRTRFMIAKTRCLSTRPWRGRC